MPAAPPASKRIKPFRVAETGSDDARPADRATSRMEDVDVSCETGSVNANADTLNAARSDPMMNEEQGRFFTVGGRGAGDQFRYGGISCFALPER